MAKRCWFNTLNDALESEGLIEFWPSGLNVGYGETVGFASGGIWLSVFRDEGGRYERPIHYATLMEDTYPEEFLAYGEEA
jgi:hypothetical protein